VVLNVVAAPEPTAICMLVCPKGTLALGERPS